MRPCLYRTLTLSYVSRGAICFYQRVSCARGTGYGAFGCGLPSPEDPLGASLKKKGREFTRHSEPYDCVARGGARHASIIYASIVGRKCFTALRRIVQWRNLDVSLSPPWLSIQDIFINMWRSLGSRYRFSMWFERKQNCVTGTVGNKNKRLKAYRKEIKVHRNGKSED